MVCCCGNAENCVLVMIDISYKRRKFALLVKM